MKTQILRLEPHDDVISARDKMGWSQTGRILLVWPERGSILNRRVDLVLLQRHSNILGAQLALITRDPDVLFNARQLSIPVYKNLNQAQRSHWRMDRRARNRRQQLAARRRTPPSDLEELRQKAHPKPSALLSNPITRIVFFCLSVLALLSIAAVLIPGAVIEITPQTRDQVIILDVRANPALDTINLSGAVPAKPVTAIVHGTATIPAHGMTQIPDRTASGLVSFTNLTDQQVNVSVGTVIRTEGDKPVRFTVTQAGIVPAGVSESVMLPVRAIEPGSPGNVSNGSLVIIEGSLGTFLDANNPTPTSGGINRSVPSPTTKDAQDLYQQLSEDLARQAIQELEKMVSPGDLLLTQTLTVTHILEKTYDPIAGEPADELNLDLRLEFQAFKASKGDLSSLAASVLDANIPHGFTPIAGSLAIKTISSPRLTNDHLIHWQLQAQRRLQATVHKSIAANLIRGLSPEVASQRLEDSLPLQGPSRIRLVPVWWPRLPLLPFRISVNTNQAAP